MKSETRIGIDIGGTFTDFVVLLPTSGLLQTLKLPTSIPDPSQSVLQGFKEVVGYQENLGLPQELSIVHGSTVATNALLEHKGARTALITTHGFKDILQIGRQNRQSLYDLFYDPPIPLVPDFLRFEAIERIDHHGDIVVPLKEDSIDHIIQQLEKHKVESVAICLLFSFLYPHHEMNIAQKIHQKGFFTSLSSEILPEFREYERTSTTVVNAYVSPILERYLSRIEEMIPKQIRHANMKLRIMQSNGGQISLQEAKRFGVRCILSGPAGGVIGSQFIYQVSTNSMNSNKIITFDMGGTSTDVSLIDGQPKITTEANLGGYPIHIPMIDIHTIGAGGGSIAYVDVGGALRVGPRSAGAYPGPACYGHCSRDEAQPTVTDANLILGRLIPEKFLGGRIHLDPSLAYYAILKLANKLNLDVVQTALGIIEITNTIMEGAIRVISIERGYDPREFTLLAFGGAGGLHATNLARRLGIPRILIPPFAATLSAFGMIVADVIKDYSLTVMLPNQTPLLDVQTAFLPLLKKAKEDITKESSSSQDIFFEQILDMRYKGQSYELPVPLTQNPWMEFHNIHKQAYGYSCPNAPIEIVNLRVRAISRIPSISIKYEDKSNPDPSHALIGHRRIVLPYGEVEIPFYQGEKLRPGNIFYGPAIIVREDTTILLEPHDQCAIDNYRNLSISVNVKL